MPLPIYKPGDILSLSILTGNGPKTLGDFPIIFRDCNIDIIQATGTHGVYYGDGNFVQAAVQGAAVPICNRAAPGSILTFQDLNIQNLFFKSQYTGETLYVVITGPLK